MLNFKELPEDGNDFELLVRELLYNRGLEVYWSGKGADGGKDLYVLKLIVVILKTHHKDGWCSANTKLILGMLWARAILIALLIHVSNIIQLVIC